jgi:diguanylate cyclase (GGDEF)-like protein
MILAVLQFLENNIETNEPLTLQKTIQYLNENDTVFEKINYEEDSLNEFFEHLKEKYKDVASQSINSYKETNESFKIIAQKHKEVILDCSDESKIDISSIQSKFNEIQEHMISEITKANDKISQLSKQIKHLEEESNIDPLTKTFNRRALNNYLKKIFKKQFSKPQLHLLLIDIDDFKKINDTYGHIAGDKILIFIANLLKQTLRDGDKVFRYGGEEFVIILNRISPKECNIIANRILKNISSNKLIYKGDNIEVTASIGGTVHKQDDSIDSFIARADKALYQAKNSGKNRFISVI